MIKVPSENHENVINDVCNGMGYCRTNFLSFIKVAAICAISVDKSVDLESLFDDIYASENYASRKGFVNKIVRDLVEAHSGNYDNFYVEIVNEDGGSAGSLVKSISHMCNVIPDAWKFSDGRTLKVVEVKDTCGLTIDRLAKLGLIEDLLHYYADIDLELYEIDSNTGSIFKHCPAFAFDVVYDCASYFEAGWESWSKERQMREYFSKIPDGYSGLVPCI